jgi:hypothetical protein
MNRPLSPHALLALTLLAGCYIYDENDDTGVDVQRPAAPACPAAPVSPGPPPPAPDAGTRDTGAAPSPPPASCRGGAVDRWKELLIVEASIIQSERARNESSEAPWSFRRRLEDLAGLPAAADLAQRWLSHWRWVDSVAVLPGLPSAARVAITPRPSVDTVLLCPWLQLDPANACSGDCTSCYDRRLSLAQAPFRLIAVVNRQDLATGSACGRDGGELRFIYTAVNPRSGAPLPFTVSFEYRVALASTETRQRWAAGWRALGQLAFGPEFAARLDRLVAEGLGQATLHRVQTNEVALGEPLGLPWELRQFVPVTGDRGGLSLEPIAASHTPRLSLDGTAELGRWLQQNAGAILAGDNLLPPDMLAGGAPVPRPDFRWQAPGADPAVLAAFNRNSCSGCHGGAGPGELAFQHVAPPIGYYGGVAAGPARVSRFLHQPSGAPDELGRRARLLQTAACEPCTAYPGR